MIRNGSLAGSSLRSKRESHRSVGQRTWRDAYESLAGHRCTEIILKRLVDRSCPAAPEAFVFQRQLAELRRHWVNCRFRERIAHAMIAEQNVPDSRLCRALDCRSGVIRSFSRHAFGWGLSRRCAGFVVRTKTTLSHERTRRTESAIERGSNQIDVVLRECADQQALTLQALAHTQAALAGIRELLAKTTGQDKT